MQPRFWMVWNEGNRSPMVKHTSYHAATSEVVRLASANPNSNFFVLEALVCMAGTVTIKETPCGKDD